MALDPTIIVLFGSAGDLVWRKLIPPVLEAWAESAPRDFPNYAAGTWGPRAADELLARAGHAWRSIA